MVVGLYFYQIKNCLSSKKEIIANNNSVNIYDFVLKDATNLVFLISFYFDQQIIFYDKDTIFLKPRLRNKTSVRKSKSNARFSLFIIHYITQRFS